MTKAELVKAIAAQTGVEAVTVATVVEQMMEEIRQSMIGGENVYLRGFGSFILKHRAQKVARNIAKNTSITIPAHNIPAFKPSKEAVMVFATGAQRPAPSRAAGRFSPTAVIA